LLKFIPKTHGFAGDPIFTGAGEKISDIFTGAGVKISVF